MAQKTYDKSSLATHVYKAVAEIRCCSPEDIHGATEISAKEIMAAGAILEEWLDRNILSPTDFGSPATTDIKTVTSRKCKNSCMDPAEPTTVQIFCDIVLSKLGL